MDFREDAIAAAIALRKAAQEKNDVVLALAATAELARLSEIEQLKCDALHIAEKWLQCFGVDPADIDLWVIDCRLPHMIDSGHWDIMNTHVPGLTALNWSISDSDFEGIVNHATQSMSEVSIYIRLSGGKVKRPVHTLADIGLALEEEQRYLDSTPG
jgi:hypothetical protein